MLAYALRIDLQRFLVKETGKTIKDCCKTVSILYSATQPGLKIQSAIERQFRTQTPPHQIHQIMLLLHFIWCSSIQFSVYSLAIHRLEQDILAYKSCSWWDRWLPF